MAVQDNFNSRLCGLPSGAKRRKARPGASRGGAPQGGARPPLLGAPLAYARETALPCPCGGGPLSGETSPFPRTSSTGAVPSLFAASEKRRPGADGPHARKMRRPHRKRTPRTLRMRTPKADEAGGPSPPAHPWRVGGRFVPGKAGAGARRAAEGLRTERGHARMDAPGPGPQRRAKGAAKARPWFGADKAVYFGQAYRALVSWWWIVFPIPDPPFFFPLSPPRAIILSMTIAGNA